MKNMNSKVLVCVVVLLLSVSACRKPPAGDAQTAATPQGSGTPATAGQPATPGQPAAPGQPPAPVVAKPVPAERRDEILRGALDQLITYVLLKQESKTRGIKIDDAEIESKMGQLKA